MCWLEECRQELLNTFDMNKLMNLLKGNAALQLLSSRLFIQITTVLQSIILSRLLGPQGKGEFTEIILWPTLIGSISMLGLYTGIVRLSAKENHYKNFNITSVVLRSTFITGIFGLIAAYFVNLYFFEGTNLLQIALFYCIYVLIYNVNRGLSAINNGRGNLGLYSVASSILNPVYLFLLLVLFLTNCVSLDTALIALLLANLSSCVVLFIKRDKTRRPRAYKPGRLIKYSVKFFPSDISEPIYTYFDKTIIALFFSAYDLGIYTIAASSASLSSFVSNSFAIKIFSDVARGQSKDIYSTLRLSLLLMVSVSFVMLFLLPFAIPLVFGSAFRPSIIPSLLLLPVCVMQGQSCIMERAILAKGFPFVGVKAKVISMITFAVIAVCLFLIDVIQLNIVIGSLLLVQLIYLCYLKKKFNNIFYSSSLLPKKEDYLTLCKQIRYLILKR